MERKSFCDIDDVGTYMYSEADEGKVVCAVLLYDEASELIKCLLGLPDVTIGGIDFEHEDYSGYDKEYYITIDSDLIVDVCKAYRNDYGYIGTESDITLFSGNASSKTIRKIESDVQYEIVIGNYDEEDSCSEKCRDCCKDCSNCEYREFYDVFDYIITL